jgi:uncharacterized membrane protein YedE/YeeE
MVIIIGSLVIGLIIGFLGQRARMCFIGGFRDLLMIRDKELLKGAISFFASAWSTILILHVIGKFIPAMFDITNVKYVVYPSFLSATFSKFGLMSLIGGLGLGLFSTLAGGCPLRQHVMAGQGRIDAAVYLLGFYIGIIMYYLFVVKLLAKVM